MQFVIIRNSMRKCILILLLFWLTACSEHKLLKREITDRIEGITLAADDFIGSGFIGVNDNLLLFQFYDPDSLAVAYSMDGDALNLCGHFLLKGRGPKEFDQPYCRMSQNDVHIINCEGYCSLESFRTGVVDTSAICAEFHIDSRQDIKWVNPFYFGGDFIVLEDGKVMALGDRFGEKNLLSIIDVEKKIVTPLGYWIEDGYDGPVLPKQSIYLSNSKIYMNGNKLLYACGEGRYLELLTLDGDTIVGRSAIYDTYPEYESDRDQMNYRIHRNNYRGMRVFATDAYIYVRLVPLRSPHEKFKGYPWYYFDEVEVYDWDGNFIKNYQTDTPFYAMAVTPDDKCLYTLTHSLSTNETILCRYCL